MADITIVVLVISPYGSRFHGSISGYASGMRIDWPDPGDSVMLISLMLLGSGKDSLTDAQEDDEFVSIETR